MKKTLLITLEFPPFFGGVGNYYYNIVKRLPSESITVLNGNDKNPSFKFGFKIYQKKLLTKIPIWPKWFFSIFKIIYLVKKEDIKSLWVGQVLPIGTICLIIKKLLKIPYFVSLHGTDVLTAQKNPRKKRILLKILKLATFITANSLYTKNEIIKLGIPNNKIIVIYPCANNIKSISQNDLDDFKLKYNFTNNTLLSVCRLTARKNLDTVIRAMPEIIKTFPNLKYFIVGNGEELDNLNKLINNLALKESVKILTNITDHELPYFYSLTDVFILTPKMVGGGVEGLGIVFLEASLHSKPIITSENGGIPEAVIKNKTGLMIDPESHQQISRAIIKLLNDKNLSQKLGNQAKQYVSENFQWTQEINKLLNAINHYI